MSTWTCRACIRDLREAGIDRVYIPPPATAEPVWCALGCGALAPRAEVLHELQIAALMPTATTLQATVIESTPAPLPDDLLTPPEVAKLLIKSESWLAHHREDGHAVHRVENEAVETGSGRNR